MKLPIVSQIIINIEICSNNEPIHGLMKRNIIACVLSEYSTGCATAKLSWGNAGLHEETMRLFYSFYAS